MNLRATRKNSSVKSSEFLKGLLLKKNFFFTIILGLKSIIALVLVIFALL